MRYELQPVLHSTLPDVAGFLYRWYNSEGEGSPSKKLARENVDSIERRLRWLLIDNPVAIPNSPIGYCLRDGAGLVRGLNLFSPAAFLSGDKRLFGLCSGTFFVEPGARSLGFYLFKKYLNAPGYSFYFACTCNTYSSEIWRGVGASPVPNSETEYILPLRLGAVIAAYVAYRTSNQHAARIAGVCGRSANPILRFLTRPSAKLAMEPCQDWEKLSALSRRHHFPDRITSERSPALLQWRYGPGSPSHPCDVYLLRDGLGNEGWISVGHLTRGEGCQLRTSVLLDAIWPREKISYRDILETVLRIATATSDAVSFRWQPGLDYSEYSRCVIPRKLAAPRAFVSIAKGAPRFPLDSLDYDDSESIAWTFQWRNA